MVRLHCLPIIRSRLVLNPLITFKRRGKGEGIMVVSVFVYVIWGASVCLVADTIRRALKNTHPLNVRR